MPVCHAVQAALQDAVIAADGHTYERSALEQWLQHHDTSPVTGATLPHKRLLPNMLIKQAIALQLQ